MKEFAEYFSDALIIVTGILFLIIPVYALVLIIIKYKWTAVLCITGFLTAVIIVAFILRKKDKARIEKERRALK